MLVLLPYKFGMTDRQTLSDYFDYVRVQMTDEVLYIAKNWNEIWNANAYDDGDNGDNTDDQKHKLEVSKTEQTTMNKIILSIFTILALASVSWGGMEETFQRNLVMDPFWPERDVCNNSNDPDKVELGPCDFSRFPSCRYERWWGTFLSLFILIPSFVESTVASWHLYFAWLHFMKYAIVSTKILAWVPSL